MDAMWSRKAQQGSFVGGARPKSKVLLQGPARDQAFNLTGRTGGVLCSELYVIPYMHMRWRCGVVDHAMKGSRHQATDVVLAAIHFQRCTWLCIFKESA